MPDQIKWTVTPLEYVRDSGWNYQVKGNFIELRLCPFCDGINRRGDRDRHTFIVHRMDGNFKCLRTSCGAAGSFWKLIESQGDDPRQFIDREASRKPEKRKKEKAKKFVYGR